MDCCGMVRGSNKDLKGINARCMRKKQRNQKYTENIVIINLNRPGMRSKNLLGINSIRYRSCRGKQMGEKLGKK